MRKSVVCIMLFMVCLGFVVFLPVSAQTNRPLRMKRPVKQVRGVKSAFVSGRFIKSNKKPQGYIPIPQDKVDRLKVPQAKVHSIADATSIIKNVKGTEQLLEGISTDDLSEKTSLLLTPNNPSGPLTGVASNSLTLFGVFFQTGIRSLEGCVREDRVLIYGAGYNQHRVGVFLQDVTPGWYLVGADFISRTTGDYQIHGEYFIEDLESGRYELDYQMEYGEKLYVPVMLRVPEGKPDVNVGFHLPENKPFWFYGVTVQRLDADTR